MQRGDLFIVSAPSGAGKTTIVQRLMSGPLAASGSLVYSVSYTSRQPRAGEVEGRDYHFVDVPTFERMVEAGQFLEWAEVHGEYKGTAMSTVEPQLERGLDVLLDIDVQGAEQVRSRLPEVHSILVLPPSYAELERRLERRALDAAETIARRLAVSLWEIERYEHYDYVIINDDLGRATSALAAIIQDKQHRLDRMRDRVTDVIDDFEAHMRR